jgi:hypothetical protein
MIENLTIKIQWLCHPLSAVYYVFIPFATIYHPLLRVLNWFILACGGERKNADDADLNGFTQILI